jgi:hypothetical protein
MSYVRPRGEITTVLDRADRDAQDSFLFPLNTEQSWFSRDSELDTVYPSVTCIQEYPVRGTADWGGFFTFELDSVNTGDLLRSVVLQIKLGHWYNNNILAALATRQITSISGSDDTWTYIEGLGTSILEYAELVAGDVTVERVTGEFHRVFSSLFPDINTIIGVANDAMGTAPFVEVTDNNGAFLPTRPWVTEGGVLHCPLPFFFLRTRLRESFPLLACREGSVRINVKLRPFHEVVRRSAGYRENCTDTPLGAELIGLPNDVLINTSNGVPPFRDFRLLTFTAMLDGSLRSKFLRSPFEQMYRNVQTFYFDEPMKYAVSKQNSSSDYVDIQLALELNHPVEELVWVFRRKAVVMNNEWSNFRPYVETQIRMRADGSRPIYRDWLESATIRANGVVVNSAEGEWYRRNVAEAHRGGWVAWSQYVYGYSFSRDLDSYQPNGWINTSRANSITINMRVNTPVAIPLNGGGAFVENYSQNVSQGWEVFVFAIGINWMRFQNGMCNRLFED